MSAEGLIDRLERSYAESKTAADSDTQFVEADHELIVGLLRTNFEFLIEFFLAEQLDMAVPLFHTEIWSLLTDLEKERVLLAIPRGHAKTTLAKLAVIWHWLFTRHRFCVYLSNTSPIAKGACRDIIEWLSHPNFIAIYGRVKIVKHSENEGLWIFDLPLRNGKTKRCILRALGQGQQMRGINIDNQRPDLAVVDDVEDNENTASESQQKKLDQWMFGPFLQALDKRRKIMWLGNMLTKTSLLARLSRSPAWNPVVFGCLIKDSLGRLRPLWPDRWSVEALIDSFQEYKGLGLTATWMCEMMNMPGHGQNGFSADQLRYLPAPDPADVEMAWLTIDPAFGLKQQNDETAIAVHVLPRGGTTPITLPPVHGHWTETQIFDQAMELARLWGAWTWGIEAVAAQRVLITLFDMLQAMRGIPNRCVFVPLMAGNGDSKAGRIRAFVALITAGDWAIADHDIDLTTQLVGLDMTKKDQADDICDAAAYGPQMYEEFRGLITHQFMASTEPLARPQYGVEVANV